ncbi:hypothetical protein [Mesorhizobium sp. M0800]|uniref:hypothetical protein n=1 Tax=Mesorhizobium sp. M0800 TaxID=2957000 RepID=UPI00333B247D
MTDDREGRLLPLLEDQLWRSGQNVAKWRICDVLGRQIDAEVTWELDIGPSPSSNGPSVITHSAPLVIQSLLWRPSREDLFAVRQNINPFIDTADPDGIDSRPF